MSVRIIHGDMLAELPKLDADSIDACCTDPPYHLTSIVKRFGGANAAPAKGNDAYMRASRGFMGKTWDGGDIALCPETWEAVWRVLKPGAHLLAFGGTRTYHRLVCAIEDAGFEVRDTVGWLFGSGFPKSLDVSKAIDKAAGAERQVIGERYTVKRIKPGATVEREGAWGKQDIDYTATDSIPATTNALQWQGWGTALKPAMELICVARKPLGEKTVAANVLRHGTGAINVDGSRVETADGYTENAVTQGINTAQTSYAPAVARRTFEPAPLGRWPANVVHDGSEEVLAAFPNSDGGGDIHKRSSPKTNGIYGAFEGADDRWSGYPGTGTAARFFYTAKADVADRAGSKHPTVKPTDLMRWLVRLVTPPGGTVLDPFCGTGSTLLAADQQQFNAIGIEQDATYAEDARRKFERDAGLFAEIGA